MNNDVKSTHTYIEDSRNEDVLIYINGEYFKRSEAKISVFDSGFLLGDGIWEGIRYHKNAFIFLYEHLDRLYEGAKSLSIDIGFSKEDLVELLQDLMKKNNMSNDIHIRLIVSRGLKKTPYQHPKATFGNPTIVIIPEYKIADKSVLEKGIKLALVDTIRDFRVQNPNINSLSKHNCIAACIEAEKKGADEGLMLDPEGFVSTCNSTNFFIIRSNEVWTSSGRYCLHGITRSTVIDLCKHNDVPVFEKNFTIEEVYTADEVFVTGTFAGIIPVISVDDVLFSNGSRGELTLFLQKLYRKHLES